MASRSRVIQLITVMVILVFMLLSSMLSMGATTSTQTSAAVVLSSTAAIEEVWSLPFSHPAYAVPWRNGDAIALVGGKDRSWLKMYTVYSKTKLCSLDLQSPILRLVWHPRLPRLAVVTKSKVVEVDVKECEIVYSRRITSRLYTWQPYTWTILSERLVSAGEYLEKYMESETGLMSPRIQPLDMASLVVDGKEYIVILGYDMDGPLVLHLWLMNMKAKRLAMWTITMESSVREAVLQVQTLSRVVARKTNITMSYLPLILVEAIDATGNTKIAVFAAQPERRSLPQLFLIEYQNPKGIPSAAWAGDKLLILYPNGTLTAYLVKTSPPSIEPNPVFRVNLPVEPSNHPHALAYDAVHNTIIISARDNRVYAYRVPTILKGTFILIPPPTFTTTSIVGTTTKTVTSTTTTTTTTTVTYTHTTTRTITETVTLPPKTITIHNTVTVTVPVTRTYTKTQTITKTRPVTQTRTVTQTVSVTITKTTTKTTTITKTKTKLVCTTKTRTRVVKTTTTKTIIMERNPPQKKLLQLVLLTMLAATSIRILRL